LLVKTADASGKAALARTRGKTWRRQPRPTRAPSVLECLRASAAFGRPKSEMRPKGANQRPQTSMIFRFPPGGGSVM